MQQRVNEFVHSHFSRISLSIIVLEAAVIFGLVYFFVPVGNLAKELSGILGTLLSIGVGFRILVWFIRELRNLLSSGPSTEGGEVEVGGSRSRPIEDALQTTDERFDEEVSRITDWIRIDEHGIITLVPESDIQDDPKYLLYVVAAKVAHELNKRDSPRVSRKELDEEVTTTFPVDPFLGKASQLLHFYHHSDQFDRWLDIPPTSRAGVEVEVDVNEIEGAVEWIVAGTRNVPNHIADH